MSCSSASRELLTFWLAGSLDPAEAALVSSHVDTCADCREAAIDGLAVIEGFRELHLRADEVVTAAAGELHAPHLLVCPQCRAEVAMLREVNADLARASNRGGGARQWRTALAAAAVVAIAVPLVWRVIPSPEKLGGGPPRDVAPQAPAPAPPLLARISVDKASLAALANESVVLRGSPSPRRALLDDLAQALEPYRRDDFGEALTRLTALDLRHPGAPEIAYYRGVCLLLLARPAEAVAPLQDAARGMTPADDATYYLAAARVNAAQTTAESEAALAEMARLCRGRSDVAARACAALGQQPNPPPR